MPKGLAYHQRHHRLRWKRTVDAIKRNGLVGAGVPGNRHEFLRRMFTRPINEKAVIERRLILNQLQLPVGLWLMVGVVHA